MCCFLFFTWQVSNTCGGFNYTETVSRIQGNLEFPEDSGTRWLEVVLQASGKQAGVPAATRATPALGAGLEVSLLSRSGENSRTRERSPGPVGSPWECSHSPRPAQIGFHLQQEKILEIQHCLASFLTNRCGLFRNHSASF